MSGKWISKKYSLPISTPMNQESIKYVPSSRVTCETMFHLYRQRVDSICGYYLTIPYNISTLCHTILLHYAIPYYKVGNYTILIQCLCYTVPCYRVAICQVCMVHLVHRRWRRKFLRSYIILFLVFAVFLLEHSEF